MLLEFVSSKQTFKPTKSRACMHDVPPPCGDNECLNGPPVIETYALCKNCVKHGVEFAAFCLNRRGLTSQGPRLEV